MVLEEVLLLRPRIKELYGNLLFIASLAIGLGFFSCWLGTDRKVLHDYT